MSKRNPFFFTFTGSPKGSVAPPWRPDAAWTREMYPARDSEIWMDRKGDERL